MYIVLEYATTTNKTKFFVVDLGVSQLKGLGSDLLDHYFHQPRQILSSTFWLNHNQNH